LTPTPNTIIVDALSLSVIAVMYLADDVGGYSELSHGLGGSVSDRAVRNLAIGFGGTLALPKRAPFREGGVFVNLSIFHALSLSLSRYLCPLSLRPKV
jgi:hypothetical protein